MPDSNRTRKTLDPAPGALIGGKYEIDRLIARGGVGVVYLARDRDKNRDVVVKVLAGHLTGESEASARFDREVERLSALQHPNIVELLGHGTENGAPYLVMEYLQGESLLAYLTRKGHLSLAEFVPLAAQILKALGYAHGRGLMHRDIKPANIMLITRKGRANFVKLLDFGMAKLVEGERDITSEQVLGTANYMAPEQVRGEPLDARVDVYACGLLFYRMLAGAPPFVADNNSALLYKQVHEQPAPLAVRMPPGHEVPVELLTLIDRCIAKDPKQRPDDANALTEALVATAPSHLFRLPLAEGADPSATASTLSLVSEPSSASTSGAGEVSSASMRPLRTTSRRRYNTAMMSRGNSVLPGHSNSEVSMEGEVNTDSLVSISAPTETGGSRWIWIAGVAVVVVVLAAVILGGGGSSDSENAAAGAMDERLAAARLDQVDAMILSGEFNKAREELKALRPHLERVPNGISRADAQERRIAVLIALEVARRFEQAGDKGAAEKAYRDVLALDGGNAEARNGLARMTSGARPVEPEPADDPRPKPRPRTKDRPEPKTAPPPETKKTDGKNEDLFKLPGKKNEDSIFLPTNKK